MKGIWGRKTNHKYGAVRCVHDYIKFASKLEMHYYQRLEMLQKNGVVSFFLIQVPFRIEAGVKYVVDFIVFYTDGRIEFIDVKGCDTPISKLKRKQVEAKYPIEIRVVTKT